MIWKHFPYGMSFPVRDFSDETKKTCWRTALSALAAGGQYDGLQLLENCAKHKAGSADLEYVCILDHQSVKQSRLNSKVWRDMPLLFPHLSLHDPMLQANALDPFAPYPVLGIVGEDGSIQVNEAGKAFLPDRLPKPMPTGGNGRVLVALKAHRTALGYSESLRSVGLAAAECGRKVAYCPYADGGTGTAYALAFARRGRLEWLPLKGEEGERRDALLGVIPGFTAVLDAADCASGGSSFLIGAAIRKVWDLGYRNLVIAMKECTIRDKGEGMMRALSDANGNVDVRMKESSVLLLTDTGRDTEYCVDVLLRLGARQTAAEPYLGEQTRIMDCCRNADCIIAEERLGEILLKKQKIGELPDSVRIHAVMKAEANDANGLYRIFSAALS